MISPMHEACRWLFGLFLVAGHAQAQPGPVLFVRADAPTGGNGQSWATAYANLSRALEQAFVSSTVEEIWVAAGTYRPHEFGLDPLNRRNSFRLVGDVPVFGGFVGSETMRSQRDWLANPTVLSGDLADDDLPGFQNYGDNCHTVVTAEGFAVGTGVATIDGFHIQRGNADGGGEGGGLFQTQAELIMRNCTVSLCTSTRGGAGIYLQSYPATLEDCTIEHNQAFGDTPGIEADQTFSGPLRIERCVIRHNTAISSGGASGAAIELNREGVVVGCQIYGNIGGTAGGAVLTPRTYLINSHVFGNSTPRGVGGVVGGQIVNSMIIGNFGDSLGGVSLGRADPGIAPSIFNSVVAYNESDDDLAGVHVHGTQVVRIDNTIIWANEGIGIPSQDMQIGGEAAFARVDHSCVQFWDGSLLGVGSFGENPQFVDPFGPDGIPGTEDDDLRLRRSSPCIDAGDNLRVAPDEGDLDGDGDRFEPTPFDLAGDDRFACGWIAAPTGNGTPPLVDVGPHELQVECIPDFNSDCRLDIFDFLGFQGAFFLMEPRADLNQSTGAGVFDIFDFITFQDLFLAGCTK